MAVSTGKITFGKGLFVLALILILIYVAAIPAGIDRDIRSMFFGAGFAAFIGGWIFE